MVWPRRRQRAAEGSGNSTVLMHTGTTVTGQRWSGQSSAIGSVKAWSTSISWQTTGSNSAATSDSTRCHDSSSLPANGATCGRPQPSSALRYSGAAPIAKVGILSRKNSSPWSL